MTIADDMPAPAAEMKPWARWGYDPETPWGGWSGLAMAGVVLLIALVALLAVTTIAAVTLGAQFTAGAGIERLSPAMAAATMLGMLAGQTAAIGAVLLFSRLRGGRPGSVLALGPPRRGLRAYLGGFAVFIGLGFAAGLLIDLILPHDELEDLRKMAPLVQSSVWPLTLLSITLGAALSEELLFRGFLFSALVKTPLGVIGTAVVTSALWSLLHMGYSVQGLLLIFVMGLIFSAILVRFGSLRVTILVHAVYNAICFVVLKFFLDPSAATGAPASILSAWL